MHTTKQVLRSIARPRGAAQARPMVGPIVGPMVGSMVGPVIGAVTGRLDGRELPASADDAWPAASPPMRRGGAAAIGRVRLRRTRSRELALDPDERARDAREYVLRELTSVLLFLSVIAVTFLI